MRRQLTYDLQFLLQRDADGQNGRMQHGFESIGDRVAEDHYRAACLRASGLPGASYLAALLEESAHDFAHPTLAGKTYRRELRRNEGSDLLGMLHGSGALAVCAFTLVRPDWYIAAADLPSSRPAGMVRATRAALDSAGAPPGEWAFGQVHGEFDMRSQSYQLHVHGLATPHYLGKLRAHGKGRSTGRVRVPVQIKALNDPARQVSYMLQSYWPRRDTFLKDGVVRRRRQKQRIPEPYGSQVLLWLHQQKLGSMQIKLGMTNSLYQLKVRDPR